MSTGASRSSPRTTPGVAGRERPAAVDDLVGPAAERELGEAGDREAEPGADEDLRRDRPPPARARHERERRKAAGEEDHAARDALDDAERPRPQAPDRDRRERHDRDDEAGRGRRHPPAVDEEQDDEEERGDEAARDEEQRGVRGDRRPPGRRRAPADALTPRSREQQHERERHLREEDRLPAEELREDPAGGRPERRAEHAGGDPDAERALVAALDLREEVERRVTISAAPTACTQRAPTSTSNDGASPHASDAPANTSDADDERLPRPPPRDVRGRHRDEREHEVERREHPRDRGDRDVELAEDLRERERDDRGVGEREPDAEPEQRCASRRAHAVSRKRVGEHLDQRDRRPRDPPRAPRAADRARPRGTHRAVGVDVRDPAAARIEHLDLADELARRRA